jgi:hypothetical protein
LILIAREIKIDSCPKALEKYLNRFSLYVVSYRFPIELVIGGKDIQKAFLCQIFSEESESAAAKRATVGSTEPRLVNSPPLKGRG